MKMIARRSATHNTHHCRAERRFRSHQWARAAAVRLYPFSRQRGEKKENVVSREEEGDEDDGFGQKRSFDAKDVGPICVGNKKYTTPNQLGWRFGFSQFGACSSAPLLL
jgi:hypothetical protein